MDYPYEVPENWKWIKLSSVADVIMGQSPKGTSITDDSSCAPLIGGASDIGESYPIISRYTNRPTKLSEKGDIILCIRATLGRPIFSDNVYCLGRGVASIRVKIGIKEFYRYGLINFEQYLYDNATGSTFAQISSNILKNMPIPLPPLPEQYRIVAKIEALFSKLDEAKEKAQSVLDGFENRRAAILHKAFIGELTKKWRNDNNILTAWRIVKLEEIGNVVGGGTPSTSNRTYWDNGDISWITPADMRSIESKYISHGAKNITYKGLQSSSARMMPKGSVIFSSRAPIGYVAIAANELCTNQGCKSLIPSECALPEYVYFTLVYMRDSIEKLGRGTTFKEISGKIFGSISISLPTITEQKEIVRILDRLLSQEQQAKQAAENVIAQIDIMKKSILARAFRGELGTNDPNDEPAQKSL